MIETKIKIKTTSETEKSKMASNFINTISEKQENYIKSQHSKVYNDLNVFLNGDSSEREKIKEKYKDSNIIKKVIDSQGRTLNEKYKLTGGIFIVLGFILALIKLLKLPFLILAVLLSFFLGFFTKEPKDFNEVFKMKDDYSDPISHLLIQRFNNEELSLEEINKLIGFLNEEEFIESFGEDETKICIKYGDGALRKVLNKVRYNYEKKNRNDLLKKIYYK